MAQDEGLAPSLPVLETVLLTTYTNPVNFAEAVYLPAQSILYSP